MSECHCVVESVHCVDGEQADTVIRFFCITQFDSNLECVCMIELYSSSGRTERQKETDMHKPIRVKRFGEVIQLDTKCVTCGRKVDPNSTKAQLFNGYDGFTDLWNVAHEGC